MDRLRDMFKVMLCYGPTPLVLRIIRRCPLRIYWTSSLIHLARDSLVPQAFSLSHLVVRFHDGRRRCCRSVDFVSDGHPQLILVDKEPELHIVHALRLGTVDRPAYKPPNPRVPGDGLGLDFL